VIPGIVRKRKEGFKACRKPIGCPVAAGEVVVEVGGITG
jgi:hypothetical protein